MLDLDPWEPTGDGMGLRPLIEGCWGPEPDEGGRALLPAPPRAESVECWLLESSFA